VGKRENTFTALQKELREAGNPKKAKLFGRFFKTGKGEYGEGDKFIGLTLPQMHKIAKEYKSLPLVEIEKLLTSKIHEHRTIALMLLVDRYKESKKEVYELYLRNSKHINNWDLVDISSPKIVGDYLLDRDRSILFKLAKSQLLWDRRIATLATYRFLKENDFADALKIYKLLLADKEDLMHKAVGWMLREVGKRDQQVLEDFLKKHYKIMPRTMLRYAIERFPEHLRKKYLLGKT
jgi:3-methyladenine DNA glycosylase AlkD